MSTETLEQELAALKQRVEMLEAKTRPVAKSMWLEAAGTQEDDEVYRQAVRLGAEWRAQMNAEGK